MNLLSTIGRGIKGAGRGILSGIDNAAVGSLTGGGLMDAALGSNGQPFTPTDQQRKGLRGQYLMGIGSALQQGRPIAEGIQQYQQNAIGQIQAGQQAEQQNKARTMRTAFQAELQGATTPEAQRAVMVKWAPFFPKEVQDLAGALKATKPDQLTIKSTNTYTGNDGKPVLVDTFSDGSRKQVADYAPNMKITWVNVGGEKIPINEQGQRVTGLPSLVMGRSPDSMAQDKRTQPLTTATGVVAFNPMTQEATPIEVGGETLMPFRPPVDNSYRDAAIGNQSYNFHTRELDTIAKPVTDALARSSRLIETLNNGSPTALAAAVPEFLTVMAGGAGSGLRMTNAEISSIVGSRSAWDDLVAKASKFSSDPQQYPLTAIQVKNIRDMATAVTGKLLKKQQIINDGYQSLLSPNMIEHKQGVMKVRQGIANIDMDGQTKGGGGPLPVGWSATVRR
jgi:hypothetical protein